MTHSLRHHWKNMQSCPSKLVLYIYIPMSIAVMLRSKYCEIVGIFSPGVKLSYVVHKGTFPIVGNIVHKLCNRALRNSKCVPYTLAAG